MSNVINFKAKKSPIQRKRKTIAFREKNKQLKSNKRKQIDKIVIEINLKTLGRKSAKVIYSFDVKN